MIGKLLFLPLVLFLLQKDTFSPQILVYDVYKGNSPIGEMSVSRRVEGNNHIYSSESNMTVSFLMSFELRFTYEAQFTGNNLHASTTANYRDGKKINQSVGKRTGQFYVTDVDGEIKTNPAPKIDYSILTSYFVEPVGRKKVFSERWGDYIDFLPAGNRRYAMHLSNGDINYMSYKDGVCNTIEVNHSLATIKFVLREKR
ncbi:MAG: DUF6134 family protein [Bacteroidia bacterium]|nr:DUF6134 family protein [Bacteroidia bacterium]